MQPNKKTTKVSAPDNAQELTPKHGYSAAASKKWYDTHNITPEVSNYAAKFDSLEPTATGGNMDYVIRQLGGIEGYPQRDFQPILLLGAHEDGGSPDTLKERAVVSIKLNEEWNQWVDFYFPTTKAAIDWMVAFKESGCDVDIGRDEEGN